MADLPQEILLQRIEEFATEKGLSHITELLKKGALCAQGSTSFENMENLTEDEKQALIKESTHRWSQPWAMYFTVMLCSIGAAVQGWDQTGRCLPLKGVDELLIGIQVPMVQT